MNHSVIVGVRIQRPVEQASMMLKKLYYVEREIMRTLGGYLVSVSNWSLKKKIPVHLWQDSLRADALRNRVLEMRYPRRDVDQNHDPRLVSLMSLPIRSANDRELVEAVYFVMKKELCSAYELYMSGSDPLDDAPTQAFMKHFVAEVKEQIADIEAIYPDICSIFSEATEWSARLESYLREIGGIYTTDEPVSHDLPPDLQRPEYVSPYTPKRDPRFTPAVFHIYPKDLDTSAFLDRQIWMGINHANEIWASEACGTVMWEWNAMPWDFYTDIARWCYDELRHCIMGETRLQAWGLEAGIDYPLVGDFYSYVSEHGPLGILSWVHACETGSAEWKSGLMRDFAAEGDASGSQDFDYDWADESIHLMYGNKWIPYHFGGDREQAAEYIEKIGISGEAIYNATSKIWDYEPFLSRIQEKLAKVGY